ncbi:uncharacterized protein CMC5_083370 [Chondromyces crocatus]|uniref:Thioredoxin domain-containing protein n=2 Tax=Chondromyces crocatus TaxID=52 RepID=A0A0K1ETY1_CHOCO|nr:uncharacterized protein CMC5_083370 [Chondromyces crocatus]
MWWKLVSELYAPCSEHAVSIAQCVRESRACGACVPAAQLIADRFKRGASSSEVQAAYAARFGPDVRQVDAGSSPSRGPEGAPVKVVVWSDFECPSCRRAMPIIDRAFERHNGEVRLIHKFYPLPAHLHAMPAARAAFAAHAQGKYWEMERLLFENQQALTDADLLGYARKLGLDMKRFQADMESEAAMQAIAHDKEAANKAGLRGTPHILINGRYFDYGLFNIEADFGRWVDLEVKLAGEQRAATSASPAAPGSAP